MDVFNGMRVFVQVVDSGSFAAAAEVLSLSGAHVSRLIADLEQHLQTRLLQRTTRRLSLTESGERFLLRCRGILDDIRDASAEASGAHLNPRGRLRVHCMSGLGVLITPLIARYSELHPQVSMELSLSQHTPDPLEEGHDVVISIAHALPDSALVSQTIGQLFSVPCAAPRYLANHGVPDHPEQLLQHRRLHLQDFQEDEWRFQGEAGDLSVPPAPPSGPMWPTPWSRRRKRAWASACCRSSALPRPCRTARCYACCRNIGCVSALSSQCTLRGAFWTPRCARG